MANIATALADRWNMRKTRETPARRTARAAVGNATPVIVITGGTRGIGLSLAHEFCDHKHTVLLIARSEPELVAASAALSARAGTRVLTLACDVTSPTAYDEIISALRSHNCYLDGLVNNAGIGLSGPFEAAARDQLDAMLAVNIVALTRLTHRALADLVTRERGLILNIASLGGVVPGPHQAAYYATKSYVLSLTEALATEASGRGVRIAAVAPGPVGTTFHAAMGAERAAYRVVLPALSPDAVARHSYRMLMLGQRVIVPGVLPRVMYGALRVMPHPVSALVTGWLLRNPKG